MDKQTRAAINLRDEIKALVKKYEKHEHLEPFLTDLKDAARCVDACIDDVAGVK